MDSRGSSSNLSFTSASGLFNSSSDPPPLRSNASRTAGEQTFLVENILESESARLGLVIGHTVTIALSVMGNLFLIVYVWRSARFSRSGSSSQTLILNLAICDIIRPTILSPIKLYEFTSSREGRNVGDLFCKSTNFLLMLLAYVGFHTVVAISLERLLLICYPFRAREWLNAKTIGIVLFLIWLLAVVTSFAFSYELSLAHRFDLASGRSFTLCTVEFFYGDPTPKSRGYTTFVFLFYYVLPVVIIVASYSKIAMLLVRKNFLSTSTKANKADKAERASSALEMVGNSKASSFSRLHHADSRNERNNEHSDHDNTRADISNSINSNNSNDAAILKVMRARQCLAKMMMIIAVCFTIFNCPVFLVFLYYAWGYKIERDAIFYLTLAMFLPILSSVLNPFVYCSRTRTLRRNFHNSSVATRENAPSANIAGDLRTFKSSLWSTRARAEQGQRRSGRFQA